MYLSEKNQHTLIKWGLLYIIISLLLLCLKLFVHWQRKCTF